ncbi:hypothetical protein BBP00_00003812 [Phytophthora kernoviae]|uniref:Myosin motor domain-containing protein n=1 Tax=Phytophthora kernoviae TaxID=325452 RepID=A0A3F2RTD9_9STRA|nr:hypothetical protein BBP00_00003812 [Phytophthora kernoviae]
MDVGARVWIADHADESVWLPARILKASTNAVSVELDEQIREKATSRRRNSYEEEPDKSQQAPRNVPLDFTSSGECTNVLPRNLPTEQDHRDLVALPHLHEASILNALRLRYARHAIYTHIGEILISINPFQNLPELYGDEILQGYVYDHKSQYGDRIAASDPREPHLFAVARAAYTDIVQNERSQSILISGESGAGKTEATKIMMTYFALTCGTGNRVDEMKEVNAPDSPRTTIEDQVLQSNPILEAFGNARTVRNDNSSRFGKFIELRFRDQRRKLAGARIRTYLLEKIRVIKQAPHERNFHIFYELLSAGTDCVSKEQRQALALGGGAKSFRLLNQSLCSKRRDGVKDAEQFRATRRAMHQLGMSEREIAGVLEIVAAVLHMGNVDFEQIPHTRGDNVFADEARVVSEPTGVCDHFKTAAELLGVTTEALGQALTKRRLHASNETLVVGVDVAHARNTRNALTMECYRLLFEWLVGRVNSKLQRQADTPWDTDQDFQNDDESEAKDFIGLLDIFGFEDMAENSFEQLCINYANEALQHQFNQYIFEEEQRLYRDEGIRWSFVDFPNNRACLELFEHRPIGIFSLTDQECVFPQGTDRALVAKYYLEFEKKTQHPHFCSAAALQRTTHFVVAHYAGCVTYTADGFLAKNKDSFCESAAQLLAESSNPLIQSLAMGLTNASAASEIDGNGGRNIRRAKSAISAVSVGTQFKVQLNDLLATVRATTPRYVRCIKPNDSHVGSLFQSTRVVEQLRSGGVLEAVRVARAGFPVRLSHQQFLGRYRRVLLSLCKSADKGLEKHERGWDELDKCLHQLTQVLLANSSSGVEADEEDGDDEVARQIRCGVSLGKTRVFFRRKPYEKLENLRVQCAVRARVAKQALKMLREESRNVSKLQIDNAQLKDELAELRRQMMAMETQLVLSTTKERQQLPVSFPKVDEPALKSPRKAVAFQSLDPALDNPAIDNPAIDNSNQNDCENQLELELTDDILTFDNGGNPNAATGRDVFCVDLSHNQQKPKLQTPNSRRPRRFSLPPMLTPAQEEEELAITPPASPRVSRTRERRHSLDLWKLQEVEAQEEACQLRDEIREAAEAEAAADEPSPERQQQQEIALQKLVASQIKRKTMQLQLQLPEFELKVDNNSFDAGPASCMNHRRRLLTRRHHCRQCGNSFCYEHSTRQLALPHLGYMAAQRVCDECFEVHIQAMTSLKVPSLIRHPTDELSSSSFASSPRGLESNDSYSGVDSPTARVTPLRV